MTNIGSMMDPHINITEPSKKFTGANKMTSNATTIEFYDTGMDGVREYHTAFLKD